MKGKRGSCPRFFYIAGNPVRLPSALGSTGLNARVETRSEPLHPKPRTTLQEECGEEVIQIP